MNHVEVPAWGWAAFIALVVALLSVDLVAHRGGRGTSRRASLWWTAGWIGVGLGFTGFVHLALGSRPAGEYLGVYLMEKALSIDNMFIFLVILRSLDIDEKAQRRALSWGIFGALLFRGLFIVAGAVAIQRWHAVVYVFGAILLVAAYRVFRQDPAQKQESRIANWLRRRLPITRDVPESKFVVRRRGRWRGTPLVVALVG